MDLRDYMRVLRRRWRVISAITFALAAAAATFSLLQTPQYQSSARLFVTTSPSDSSDAYQGGLFSVQRVSSYADLVSNSRDLAQTVITSLHLEISPDSLLKKVTTEVVAETVVLKISITDGSAREAQAIAGSYATNLTNLVRQLETPPGQSVPPIKATVVDDASLPSTAISPRPTRDIGIALVLGLIVGFGVALLREVLDATIKTPDDVAAVLDTPLMGVMSFDALARDAPLITALDTHAPRVESFRVLRTNLQFVDVDATEKVFVVTSGVPEEGKTTTAVNLAITLAQAGTKTLLIEGDLRRPRAHTALGLDGSTGVTSVLVGQVGLPDAVQLHAETGLHVLASGPVPPNPADLLQSKAMKQLFRDCRSGYDMVIVDAPPLLPVTDGALLAAESDGALLVVRHGKTTRDQLTRSKERLGQVDAPLVGAVLNMVPDRAIKSGYGYGYGYGYAPTGDRSRRPKTSKERRRAKA